MSEHTDIFGPTKARRETRAGDVVTALCVAVILVAAGAGLGVIAAVAVLAP